MKLIDLCGPYITVELSPADVLALHDACAPIPDEYHPLREALGEALLSSALYAWRMEDGGGNGGEYTAEALRRAYPVEKRGKP